LRSIRAQVLEESRVEVAWNLKVERGDFESWIRRVKPQVWIHHHHFMEEFRSPSYDHARARKISLDPLAQTLKTLKEVGCRGVLYSGTYFEPGEGGLENSGEPTPYARSKNETWKALENLCSEHGLLLSKVVIPNPIGPFENSDRLIPQMIRAARAKAPFTLGSPDTVGDQIAVTALSKTYLMAAENLLKNRSGVYRPSGFQGPLRAWVEKIQSEFLVSKLKLEKTKIEFGNQPARNLVNRSDEVNKVDWAQVWDHYAEWLARYPDTPELS